MTKTKAEYAKAYRERHPERARRASREWAARNYALHPEMVKEAGRQRWRTTRKFSRYGTSADWFRDQLVGQAGRCAICGAVFKSSKDTHIDHSHATGSVRSLLCGNCNRLIGLAHEDPALLRQAIAYLEKQLCLLDQTGRP